MRDPVHTPAHPTSQSAEGHSERKGLRLTDWWATLGRTGSRTFWLACALVLGAQFVGMLVYSGYLFHRFDLTDDFATYSQAWWLIGHGHLNPIDTVQTPNYPFWQSHFELAMWPVALIGRVWPNPLQLLWLQDAAMVATEAIAMSWVIALSASVASRFRSPVVIAALAFLVLNPWWYLAASFDVHFELLGLPLVMWSAYSLWRGRTRSAFVTGAVALLFGDVVAISVLCIGVAGLISTRVRRRSGPWISIAMASTALVWVVLATVLGGNKGSGITSNYGYLVGADPTATSGWVVTHLVLHPGHMLHVLVDRRGAIGRVVASAGLLGVATPWGFVITVGIVGPAALNVNRAFLSPSIAFQTLAVIPFVFVGTVMVLLRLATGLRFENRGVSATSEAPQRGPVVRWRVVLAVVLAAAVITAALVQNSSLYGSLRANWWRVDAPTAATLRASLSLVPADAQVVVSQGVSGRFGSRAFIYPFLASPQAFPVRSSVVAFVIVPSQGIESVPPTLADQTVTALVEHFHASRLTARDGVNVVLWRPPPGVRSFVLPGP